MKRSLYLFLTAALFYIGSSVLTMAQVNLLKNGSFERFSTAGIPDAWTSVGCGTRGLFQLSTSCGDYVMRIYDDSTGSSAYLSSDDIPVTPCVSYTATAYIKRVDIVNSAAAIYIKYYDAEGTAVGTASMYSTGAASVWNYVTLTETAPANAVTAKVLCYSSSISTGNIYFDGISFGRSPSQGMVDNPNMSLDAVGAWYPVNWEMWGAVSEPVSVALSPTSTNNLVMKLVDNSASAMATAMSTLMPVLPNATYTASADMYWAAGTTAPRLYIKYYDTAGAVVGSTNVNATSLTNWGTKSVSLQAPTNAAGARLLALSGATASYTGTVSYFDNFSFVPKTQITRYVSPDGTGAGTDSAAPAKYNNSTFWNGVKTCLTTNPVKVVFLVGGYVINSNADRLTLTNIGNANNPLTIEGERPYSSVFTRNDSATNTLNMVTLQYATNVIIRHLHWEDDTTNTNKLTSYSFLITSGTTIETKNIIVEGCSFVGLNMNTYGAMGIQQKKTHDVIVSNCEFIRGGYDSHFHMAYNVYGSYNMLFKNNYFQDCSGAYLRWRSGCHDVTMTENDFVSTAGTFNEHFLEVAVFNDVDPGNEIWGYNFTFTSNIFTYATTGAENIAVNFYHMGFDPNVGLSGTNTWHYLLTSAKAATLSSGTLAAKTAILKDDYGLQSATYGTNVAVTIAGNERPGYHTYNVNLESYSGYSYTDTNGVYHACPDYGGNGEYNISSVFPND